MSNSLSSTSHSQKIKLTISPNLCWLSLWNIHHTRFGNISKQIDGILRWIHTEVHCADPGCTCCKYSQVEKAQVMSPRLLSLLPFLTFHHVRQPPIQPYTTAIIQTLYHIFSSICQSFSTSRWWLGFHLTSVSMPLHLRPHHLAAIHLCRPNKEPVECKYDGIIVHSGICHRY